MQCSAAQYGDLLCGVVQYDVVLCGAMWCGAVRGGRWGAFWIVALVGRGAGRRRYSAIWCGDVAVRCGTQCGVVLCSVCCAKNRAVLCDVVLCGVLCGVVVRCGGVLWCAVWCCAVRCGSTRCSVVLYGPFVFGTML